VKHYHVTTSSILLLVTELTLTHGLGDINVWA